MHCKVKIAIDPALSPSPSVTSFVGLTVSASMMLAPPCWPVRPALAPRETVFVMPCVAWLARPPTARPTISVPNRPSLRHGAPELRRQLGKSIATDEATEEALKTSIRDNANV
jgi:hypothetical protein